MTSQIDDATVGSHPQCQCRCCVTYVCPSRPPGRHQSQNSSTILQHTIQTNVEFFHYIVIIKYASSLVLRWVEHCKYIISYVLGVVAVPQSRSLPSLASSKILKNSLATQSYKSKTFTLPSPVVR
eukprot:scaffold3964_cov77-Skeletonema_marinoi.AAC.24